MTQQSQEDVRVAATSKIWGMTVGIIAICIPLSAVTRSGPILPLAAIAGAAFSTATVWRNDDKKSPSQSFPAQRIEILEQRIANLETIVSSDELDLHTKIQTLEANNIYRVPIQSSTPETKT
ncbi:hypothetical protein ACQFX9_28290 [Aliinostoc sp. HNIBRCY26]|uniref:hypothetical protein n=1 Tax=Aliinostoc sp. HNIBRCY26 TaxID=3418997 RepID=UPI003D01C380